MAKPRFSGKVERGIEIFLPLLQNEKVEIMDIGPRGYKSRGWSSGQWHDFCAGLDYLEQMIAHRQQLATSRRLEKEARKGAGNGS